MAEPDHLFLRPLPNLAHGTKPAGYPFFYIKPAENKKIIRKFYPEEKGPVTDVDPIGNSPVIIHKVNSPIAHMSCLIGYYLYIFEKKLEENKQFLLLFEEKLKIQIIQENEFSGPTLTYFIAITITIQLIYYNYLFFLSEIVSS